MTIWKYLDANTVVWTIAHIYLYTNDHMWHYYDRTTTVKIRFIRTVFFALHKEDSKGCPKYIFIDLFTFSGICSIMDSFHLCNSRFKIVLSISFTIKHLFEHSWVLNKLGFECWLNLKMKRKYSKEGICKNSLYILKKRYWISKCTCIGLCCVTSDTTSCTCQAILICQISHICPFVDWWYFHIFKALSPMATILINRAAMQSLSPHPGTRPVGEGGCMEIEVLLDSCI